MKLFENKNDAAERAALISVDTGQEDAEASVKELEELAKTAGAETVCVIVQRREAPSPRAYLGAGRLEELAGFCSSHDVDLIVADGELSPVQARNIEDSCGVRTIDRTMLILDIFASRARSAEGRIQVELAQLKYMQPRLTGMGKSLSRLGGGIGTRGPGETKLETDRRHIRRRVEKLEQELKKIENRRAAAHRRRKKDGAACVAIVGYTNAGKSTLMNTLTNAGVLAEDKLFATLDPTARRLRLPDGRDVMLIDTVGLVRRLPHELVDAFRSTLEEALWADVILNVCDASSPFCAEHMRVTADLLSSLGCDGKCVINVLNKCDIAPQTLDFPMVGGVRISAKTGFGISGLLEKISDALPLRRRRARLLIPYERSSLEQRLYAGGSVLSREYTENGALLEVFADVELLDELKDFIL